MGIRIPDVGDEMSILMRSETPAEAPAVRKIWFGLAGYPSRSNNRLVRHQIL